MDYEAEAVSADTGNPVPTPEVEAQPEEQEVIADTEVEETEDEEETTDDEITPVVQEEKESALVELPDGRKLPPKEAESEYRKLYSDYTRKSQKLATYEKSGDTTITNNKQDEEGWVPQTWEEVKREAVREMKETLAREQQQESEIRKQNEDFVIAQLDEIKQTDPNLNESQLFSHAIKYNFTDLKVAHANLKEIHSSIKKTTDRVVQNIQKRNAEPISGGSQGGDVMSGDVYDPSIRNMSMVDYLRSIK
jgi:hypothetical protein